MHLVYPLVKKVISSDLLWMPQLTSWIMVNLLFHLLIQVKPMPTLPQVLAQKFSLANWQSESAAISALMDCQLFRQYCMCLVFWAHQKSIQQRSGKTISQILKSYIPSDHMLPHTSIQHLVFVHRDLHSKLNMAWEYVFLQLCKFSLEIQVLVIPDLLLKLCSKDMPKYLAILTELTEVCVQQSKTKLFQLIHSNWSMYHS